MIRTILPAADLPFAENVTWFGPELRAVACDMWDTLYFANAHALTAPQVGEALRMVVIDLRWQTGDKEPVALVNPSIIESAPGLHIMEAGCLSEPGQMYRVGRPIWAEVGWTSLAGVQQTARFHGFGVAHVCQALALIDGRKLSEEGKPL